MSVDLVETELGELLNLSPGSECTLDLHILQHFRSFTSLTLGGKLCKGVMHSFVAQKAREYPFLMHMVMAVSSAHLKRLYAGAAQMRQHQQSSIMEAYHWQTGLHEYQQQLIATDKPDFDATVATTFLTIIFTFALDDEIPIDTFGGDDSEKLTHAFNPIAATNGFRAIRDVYG